MSSPSFFHARPDVTASEIARITDAMPRDGDDLRISIDGIASLGSSSPGKLVFCEGQKNLAYLPDLRAAAVFVIQDHVSSVPKSVVALAVKSPALAFARAANYLYPQSAKPVLPASAVGPSMVHETVVLEEDVKIGPGAVVMEGVQIGRGTVIGPNSTIGPHCHIGRECAIGSNTTIQAALIGDRVIIHEGVRIGQDGFGFIPTPQGLAKIPQLGRAIVQNDVEIGANTTIDRGSIEDTIIGEGTKIDNLVQIGHNVTIGRNCILAGQCGLSGSSTLGDNVMLGGRVGIADHITIGDGAQIAAASGVMNDVPPGEKWAGAPAQPLKEFFREVAAMRSLLKQRRRGKPDE